MLIKIPFIQYLYGIKSMRQTIKEIEVNVAYRWFLGLDMLDPVPHFSTFGKNYTRRFKDTDFFEQIFSKILEDCMKYKLVNTDQIFVDATHVKACANSKKMRKRVAHERALWYEEELNKEIEKDRLAHGLTYSTTNRNGYKEYKSCGEKCAGCQYLSQCTESKDHVKLVTRHVWEEYMEAAEDIRHTIGNRTDLSIKERNHRADFWHSRRTAWISLYTIYR